MSISSDHQRILKSVTVYEKLLHDLSEEEFTLTPAEGVWSYAEVFSHIFSSNTGCLKAIEKCIEDSAIENNERLKFYVWAILFFKRFPPTVKLKVPEKIARYVVKISREEAKTMISQFRRQLDEISPRVNGTSSTQKVKHPRLGLLNAKQWYDFILVHTRHHQKQLFRIREIHQH
jgi:DinB superfamily